MCLNNTDLTRTYSYYCERKFHYKLCSMNGGDNAWKGIFSNSRMIDNLSAETCEILFHNAQ